MKRILSLGFVLTVVSAFGLVGCSDGGGDIGEGVPKGAPAEGGVKPPAGGPSIDVSADMSKMPKTAPKK
jgi:hypothetical protein